MLKKEDAERMTKMCVYPEDMVPEVLTAFVWRKANNPKWVLATIGDDTTVKPVLIANRKIKASNLLRKTIKVEKIADGRGETYRQIL